MDIGVAIFKNSSVQFSTLALARLEEKGVIFARLEDLEGVESYSAVYNGEILVQGGSAADLRKSLDSAWAKTGDDLVRELDEVRVLNQLDYLENILMTPPGGAGYLGGQKLSRAEIRTWIRKINKISDNKASLKIVAPNDPILKGNRGGFNPFSQEIVLEAGMTKFEIFHESKHLEEFVKIGKNEYIKGMKAIGGSPKDDLIRTYKRERYVYNAITKEAHLFSKTEIKAATIYINKIIKKGVNSGLDLTKIKID